MQMVHQGMNGVETMPPNCEQYSHANLFVRHLSRLVNEDELRRIFAPYGEILSAAVMRNIHTGENLGTAFVRFATTEQARTALVECNGRSLFGRTISVHWAKKQHDDTPVGEARKKIFKLFVRNIPLDITVDDLTTLFQQYGPVKDVTLHKDTAAVADRRLERRIAFVAYLVEGAAERAAECVHNTRPFASSGSIPLMVKLAEDLPARSRRHTPARSVPAAKVTFGDGRNTARPYVQAHSDGIYLSALPPRGTSAVAYADPNAQGWTPPYTTPTQQQVGNTAWPFRYDSGTNVIRVGGRYAAPQPPSLQPRLLTARAECAPRSSLAPTTTHHNIPSWQALTPFPEQTSMHNGHTKAHGLDINNSFSLATQASRGGISSRDSSSRYIQEFDDAPETRMLFPFFPHFAFMKQQQQQQDGLSGSHTSMQLASQTSCESTQDLYNTEELSTGGATSTPSLSSRRVRRYTHNPYKVCPGGVIEDSSEPVHVF
ncbi:RNA recognition motif domain [Trypanosoma melophagium]|uniref:RNA recognition motif domain n=1 Tax=Trypanosoma melophagium TaxID=715481 RepID=UPI00351A7F39|nr:RNA recognition motif domain [Trypanosoma melophagium]